MIVLLVMTDGRDELLTRALASASEHLHGPVSRIVVNDDTGDPAHAAELRSTFAHHRHPCPVDVIGGDQRRGFGGAIDHAWAHLRATAEADAARFVFHLEDDFVFRRRIHLSPMAAVLDTYPHLAQMALRRQPWNDDEKAAGGIVELHPDWYTDAGLPWMPWLEHRVCFTTNPCLYRRSLTWRGWPTVEHSEGVFTHALIASGNTFGYWGARTSGQWVEHIGTQRAGTGY